MDTTAPSTSKQPETPDLSTWDELQGEIVKGDIDCDGRVIIYVIKADKTSYINYIKPLILAEEIDVPYIVSVIDTKEEWYYKVHPERYVPAMKDMDPETKQQFTVFESTACLQYLAERFDATGIWCGQTALEKAAVLSWTAYQTAGLGPTAKYWLYFLKGYPNRQNPEPLPKTISKLHSNCIAQWNILEKRLSEPDQNYIALSDRPSLADISFFPFAIPWMFSFFGVNIKDWPHVQAWSDRMMARRAVQKIMACGPTLGH